MPILIRLRHNSSLGTESKAFLKSTKHVYVSRLTSFLFSIKKYSDEMWSWQLRFLRNPFCSSCSILFACRYLSILLFKILQNAFATHDCTVIPR